MQKVGFISALIAARDIFAADAFGNFTSADPDECWNYNGSQQDCDDHVNDGCYWLGYNCSSFVPYNNCTYLADDISCESFGCKWSNDDDQCQSDTQGEDESLAGLRSASM
jgi:hypothetical protein